MKVRILESYSLISEFHEAKKYFEKHKMDPEKFLHYGTMLKSDQEEEDYDPNNTYLDLGCFKTHKVSDTVENLSKNFASKSGKPFYYMGRRYSIQQFKGILMLRS